MSEVGFIFKLENILLGCFGDYSMKTAVIYNDTFDGEKKVTDLDLERWIW